MEDDIQLKKRFGELSHKAWQRNIPQFTDFLNLHEQSILHCMPDTQLPGKPVLFGGYSEAERQMAAFLPDALFYTEEMFPMCLVRVVPKNLRYAEALSHRDYLGTILGLGIERRCIGDILVMEKEAWIFVEETLCDLCVRELVRVRHTSVLAERMDLQAFHYTPEVETLRGTVASVRLDSLLALAFRMSRSKCVPYIQTGKVFVNGRCMTSNAYDPQSGDLISVRGEGKFRYIGEESRSRKGRIFVSIEKFI